MITVRLLILASDRGITNCLLAEGPLFSIPILGKFSSPEAISSALGDLGYWSSKTIFSNKRSQIIAIATEFRPVPGYTWVLPNTVDMIDKKFFKRIKAYLKDK